MSWSNNCYKLPRIADYAAAEKRFNDTAQPRASLWNAFQRPLGGARAHHKRIQFDPSNQAYELVLYRTPLVTYYPDGTIAVRPDSRKMSRDFLYATLPLGLSVTSHADKTMVVAHTLEGPAWYSVAIGALHFKHCGDHLWRITSPSDPRIRERMCLKRAALVRKATKPFLDWVQTTRALCGEPSAKPSAIPKYPDSLDALQDTELWPTLAAGVSDRAAWVRGAYDAFGARTEFVISDYEPPRRGRHPKFS